MIQINLLNFLIFGAFYVLWRFTGNVVAALTHDRPIGQGVSLVAA